MNVAQLNSRYPRAPSAFQEEAELWARGSGRHAKLHFAPNGTWFVRVSLKSDDGRLRLHQMGLADEPMGEDVWLHLPNPHEGKVIGDVRQGPYIPIDLEQLGVSGLREFLDRGDTWSGRGEYLSLVDQLRKVEETNEEVRVRHRAFHKEESRHEMRQSRRFRLKIPFLPVEFDFERAKNKQEKEK